MVFKGWMVNGFLWMVHGFTGRMVDGFCGWLMVLQGGCHWMVDDFYREDGRWFFVD